MIIDKVENGLVTLILSQVEAEVLHNALTAAKIAVGDNFVLGNSGRQHGINIEHLRNVLSTTIEMK